MHRLAYHLARFDLYISPAAVNTCGIRGGIYLAENIDHAAIGAVGAMAYYLFFLNAWGSIPLACALAFVCTVLSRWLLKSLPIVRRASAAQARAELLRIAGLPDADAGAELTALIAARWPEEDFRLAPVLKHPEATMTSGDVLNAWKSNRDAQRLVVAATCPCEPRARLFAGQLSAPVVAVMDSHRLTRLLRALPADSLPRPSQPSLGSRLSTLCASAAAARPSLRSALLILALLFSYMVSGSAWYLFLALAVAAHTGVALIRRGVGRRLFDAD